MATGLFVRVGNTTQEVDYIHHTGNILELHSFEASIGGFSFVFGINKIDSEEQMVETLIEAYKEALDYSTSDDRTQK